MCIFCKIASGEIPSNRLYEDDKVLAFYDLDPQAPTHFLVIPKEHIASAAEITPENAGMVAHIFATIARICAEHGWESYRVVTNCGEQAGQTVQHLHFHVLSGSFIHFCKNALETDTVAGYDLAPWLNRSHFPVPAFRRGLFLANAAAP